MNRNPGRASRSENQPVPLAWRRVRLGSVIRDAQAGFAAGQRDPHGAIQLRMNNVTSGGRFDWSSFIRVPADPSVVSTYRLEPGDVLFNNTNSVELVGKTALFNGFSEPVVFSNHFTRLRVDENLLVPEFLALCLQARWHEGLFADICHRWIGQAAIQRDRLLDLEIPLPSVLEQRRIAAVLNEQMTAVERARTAADAQLEAAKALPAGYLRKAFHGIMPLSVGDRRAAPPNGWSWRLLSTLARLESGHTPSRYHPEWWGGGTPWLSLADIRDLDGKIAHDTREHTNEQGLANSAARLLPKGTVVLSRTASVGFVSIMGREMATSQDFVNWVCGPDVEPLFLAYLLRASRDYLHTLSSGAIHQTIYMPTVEAFEVCVPDVSDQKRIAEILDERMADAAGARRAAEEQLAAMNALPAALLRQAFSGEL